MLFSPFLRKRNQPPPIEVDVFAPQDVVQRGWLWKRGALNKGFKRRWFVLTSGGELFYYKSDRHSRYKNYIPLVDSVVKWNALSQEFEVTMPERVYVMAASSVLEASDWVNWLRHFTTYNNRENLSIEQAEAFLENNEYALCELREQDRRQQKQQALVLASRRPRKAASEDCLSRKTQSPSHINPWTAYGDGDGNEETQRPPATAPECRHIAGPSSCCVVPVSPVGATKEPHGRAEHSHTCKNALLIPLALAAAGHHREKIKRARSTSN